MNKENTYWQMTRASLVGLLTLAIVQEAALFAKVDPHPPEFVGPFLGAVIALGFVCIVLLPGKSRVALVPAILFAVLNIPNVGLHKLWVHPAAKVLWPIVILGSFLIVSLLVSSIIVWKNDKKN